MRCRMMGTEEPPPITQRICLLLLPTPRVNPPYYSKQKLPHPGELFLWLDYGKVQSVWGVHTKQQPDSHYNKTTQQKNPPAYAEGFECCLGQLW
jgi:hypothetical protein